MGALVEADDVDYDCGRDERARQMDWLEPTRSDAVGFLRTIAATPQPRRQPRRYRQGRQREQSLMGVDYKRIYAENADGYDRLVSAEDCDGHLHPTIDRIHPLNGSRILEVGVGPGRPRVPECTGIWWRH